MVKKFPSAQSLKFLRVLSHECNLSTTAQKMGISVAAASRMLADLRTCFGDELFVRCKTGLLPTQRTSDLCPLIDEVLGAYEALLDENELDITTVHRDIRIACVDNALFSVCPNIVQTVQATAPGICLDFYPIDEMRFELLRTGKMDFLISPIDELPGDDYRALDLKRNEFVICCGAQHPLAVGQQADGKPVTDEQLLRYRFIDVVFERYRHNTNLLRQMIYPSLGEGQSVAKTRYFLPMMQNLINTDLLMVLPRYTVECMRVMATGEVRILQTVTQPKSNIAKLVWHRITHADPVMQWLRGIIVQSVRETI